MEWLPTQLVDQALHRLTTPIQDWLAAHPAASWLMAHPVWLLGLVMVLLLLLSGLFGAIAQLTQKLWIGILQAPLLLTRWVFAGVFQLFQALFRSKDRSQPEPQQERLAEIVARLEALKQEQDELLNEVKAILSVKDSSV